MKGITEILVLMLLFPFFAEAQIEYMCIDPSEDDEPVYDMRVEKKPAYPGGYHGLQKDIEENLVYPEDAKKEGLQGMVVVRFVVDKEGQICCSEITSSSSHVFDSAALDVLSHLKTFIPGELHGEKVNVYYLLPIQFTI